jgi:hypothetical protein
MSFGFFVARALLYLLSLWLIGLVALLLNFFLAKTNLS